MRSAVALAATVVAAFVAIGCGIAILFELQGFGRPRDTDPRFWYVGLLILALACCVAVPARLWRRAG